MSAEIPKPKPDALDVLLAIDALRRDLSGYHGQLKAWNDLRTHSERQRERIRALEELHATDKQLVADLCAENAKLRELLVGAFEDMNAWQKVIACSNEWGYGKGCLDRLCELRDAMQELGMKAVVG